MSQNSQALETESNELPEIPVVDWNDLETNREKLLDDIRFALSDCGFMVLVNVPGFEDEFQQRAFREVRGFFDAPMEIKKSAYIDKTPYFRGYSLPTPTGRGRGQVIENFQYGFEQEPVGAHNDIRFPLHERLFKGPNTWPESSSVKEFRPTVSELCDKYHRLTHDLGELITESLDEDIAEFRKYFRFDDPYLAASLNHNFSLSAYPEDERKEVHESYAKFDSDNVGTHIDGPPFIALLINDRPGLQVVAGEGGWINAPVTCRTAEGDYDVRVIPGSIIVNTGGTLMHLSEGRYSATLHRVNTTMIPYGETRISMPYFLLPQLEGDLVPFGHTEVSGKGVAGYEAGRDRGANACVNRMSTFPQVTKHWWVEEFKELKEQAASEVHAETSAAFELASKRGERFKSRKP